jgi:hypothetical protein
MSNNVVAPRAESSNDNALPASTLEGFAGNNVDSHAISLSQAQGQFKRACDAGIQNVLQDPKCWSRDIVSSPLLAIGGWLYSVPDVCACEVC